MVVAGCTARVDVVDPHPCFTRTASEFVHQEVECRPGQADVCVFDVHNRATPLDGTGNPISYDCVCTQASTYSCWGAPGLPAPEALP